jgi:predicted secreted protein
VLCCGAAAAAAVVTTVVAAVIAVGYYCFDWRSLKRRIDNIYAGEKI